MSFSLWSLLRRLWPLSLFATTMGAASGLATAALLALTNHALRDGFANPYLWAGFAGLCLLALCGEILSDIFNNVVGQRVIANLRRDLSARVIAAPLSRIEAWRAHRLTVALNQDIDTISAFAFLFSSLAIAVATLFGCLAYLAYLSPRWLLVAIVALALGTFVQARARRAGMARFGVARASEETLQGHYRSMTDGAKELRLNAPRRRRLFESELGETIDAILRYRIRAANVFVSANAFGSLLYFAVIGIMLVAMDGGDRSAVTAFVLVLLYMKGPIQEIVNALPSIGRAQISLGRIEALANRFASAEPALLAQGEAVTPEAFASIGLRAATYRFDRADEAALPRGDAGDAVDAAESRFALGPVDLTITRGETVFVVGENGSGKTTLIKVLLGLYAPTGGDVCLNGEAVPVTQLDGYRQLFSTVFSDYYLFESLPPGTSALDEEARHFLARFQIAHKVAVKDGRFTTTDLSTGQRKRLALIQAYLERRPILVLDEWAADQDPTFRRVFYHEILPELKRQGTTLIVVSHDDRYFAMADRLIRVDGGLIDVVAPESVV